MFSDRSYRLKVLCANALLVMALLLALAGHGGTTFGNGPASLGGAGSPQSYIPFISAPDVEVHFAVIGDYGDNTAAEADVAALVAGWDPDFVITTGDNNYPDGAAATIDQNIGQYYSAFIGDYVGSYGPGALSTAFYPSLGNHDWRAAGAQPYLDYFTLPSGAGSSSGNERYYDFVRGPVHFFALDSDPHEPDGRTAGSAQAAWLQSQLAGSTSAWKVVYMHHPPYSSSSAHGSDPEMQWPFKDWGASAVLAGHDHTYERIEVDGFPYFVNGLGGRSRYNFGAPIPGSQVRFNADYGAMHVEAEANMLTFRFITRAGALIDTCSLAHGQLQGTCGA